MWFASQDGCRLQTAVFVFYYCTNFNLHVFGPGVFSQSKDMNLDMTWVKAVLDWAPITVLACISSIVETSCSAGKCPINSQRAGRSGQGQQYSNSSALPRLQVLGVHAARPQGLILTGGHDALTFSIPRSLNILARLLLVLHYVFSGESTKSSQIQILVTFKLHDDDVCRMWHVKQA